MIYLFMNIIRSQWPILIFMLKIVLFKICCMFLPAVKLKQCISSLAPCHVSYSLAMQHKPHQNINSVLSIVIVSFVLPLSTLHFSLCRLMSLYYVELLIFSAFENHQFWVKIAFIFSFILKGNDDIDGIFVLCQKFQLILLTCAEHILCQHPDTMLFLIPWLDWYFLPCTSEPLHSVLLYRLFCYTE